MSLALLAAGTAAFAQQEQLTPEQKERQLYEKIQEQVDQFANTLGLEDWQVFYADSILTHDFGAMAAEFEQQAKQKVSDGSVYQYIQDKWSESTYQAFKKILTPEQWTKYLKTGARQAKKARDKRAAKSKQL